MGTGFEVVGEADSGEDAVRVVRAVRPDLLLLDLRMPRMSGLDALRELTPIGNTLRTILLAGTIDRTQLLTAVDLGARGLLLKDATTEVLFEAIACVVAGRCWLGQTLVTGNGAPSHPIVQDRQGPPGVRAHPREREVLTLIVAGYANKDIARDFAVSEETIKHHLTHMFDKVGVSNRLELAMVATERGLTARSTEPMFGANGVSVRALEKLSWMGPASRYDPTHLGATKRTASRRSIGSRDLASSDADRYR